MNTKLNLQVSQAELEYRTKHYHDLRELKQRDLSCSSCGNVLGRKSEEICAHPIFSIIQCRKCNEREKNTLSSKDSSVFCHVCAIPRKSLYECIKQSCPYKFCQACIKRNAPGSLLDAQSKNWACLACNPKPLWKLRGLCTAVMSSTSKRTKRKNVSRNKSSDTDDESTNFKNVSYVRRRQLAEAVKLRKRLSEVCDNESPIQITESSCSPFGKNHTGGTQQDLNSANTKPGNFGNKLTVATSSDNSDVEDITPIHGKTASKSQKNSPPARKKRISDSKNNSRGNDNHRGKRETKKSQAKIPTNSRHELTSSSDSSSDESDTEVTKRPANSGPAGQTFKSQMKPPSGKRKNSLDEDASDRKIASRNTSKKTSTRAAATSSGKSVKPVKEDKCSSKNSESRDDDDTDIESHRETRKSSKVLSRSSTSKQNGGSKKSAKNHDSRLKKTRRDDVGSKGLRGEDLSEKEEDANETNDGKSKKSSHLRRVKSQNAASDSSSGKEFRRSKLFRNSYVPLKRISELEQDYTKIPDASPERPKDLLSDDQTFALKNSVNYFFDELKKAADKLINDIEVAQTKYCMKESMRPMDVDRLILQTKNVVTTLKKSVDNGENRIDGYYEKWCKKTNVRNILKTRRTDDEHENVLSPSAKQGPTKSPKIDYFEDISEPSSRAVSPIERDNGAASPAESMIINEEAECTVISDCNSEEIFSGGESGKFTGKSCRRSPSKSANADLDDNKKRRERDDDEISSDDTVDNETALKATDVSISKNEPTETLDESSSSAESSKQFGIEAELRDQKIAEKSIPPCDNGTSRNSINSSEVDMFETTTEVLDDETNKEKPLNESDEEDSEIDEKSTEKSPTGAKTETSSERCLKSSRKVAEMDKNNSEIDSSDDEKSIGKSPLEITEKSNKVSSGTEINDDLSDEGKAESNRDEIVTDAITAKSLEIRDDDSRTSDGQSTRNEKSSINDCPVHENTVEIHGAESAVHVKAAGNERMSGDCEIRKKKNVEGASDDEENRESIYSLETVDGSKNENNIENDSKSQSMSDDNQDRPLSDVEKSLSKSPDCDLIDKLSSLETVVACENDAEKEGSSSPDVDNRGRRSSLETVIAENNDGDIEKSASNPPIIEEKLSSLHEKTNERKCDKKVIAESEENTMNTRSSTDMLLAELETTKKNSASKSSPDLSQSSTSSDPSEIDDLRVRDMLLMSSNSDDSSFEDSLTLRKSGAMENSKASPAPSKSDAKSREGTNENESKLVNEKKQQAVKTKRNKFHMKDNPHLMADEKLSQRCEVSISKLEKKILERHSRALKRSRDYVDSKDLKRLVALDKLDKKKTNTVNSDSEVENNTSRDLKNKKKKRATKEREETLLDHLKKVENGENIELVDQSDSEQSDKERLGAAKLQNPTEDSLFAEADRMAKKRLLESSDSAEEEPSPSEAQEELKEGNEEKKEKTKKTKNAGNTEKSDKPSENEEEKQEKARKGRWRKNKILTLRISDTDSEGEKKTFDLSQERKKNEDSQSDSGEEETRKKKRVRRRVLHSDSDVKISSSSDSESSDVSIKQKDKKSKKSKGSSDDNSKKKTRKRIRKDESGASSSDSLEEKRPKNRRKRIKTAASDSDSELDTTQGTPGKSGRKNIRKVIRDKQVADDTKQAAKDEEERLQRIAERQKLYNQMYESRLAGEKKVDKLVLDFDEETKEPLVSVDEALVKRLKPHQAQGIKFMWDACFESLERTKTTKGSGCILAHCMGLGKTFQVVALSHTLLQHEETGIKTIMVVCPLSTVLNWVNEFKMWLENLPDGDDIEIYELTRMKQNFERKYQLQRWQKTGGVMIIGYEMFRNLSNAGKKVRKNIQEVFSKSLVDPGPDMIVCDEGHLLKNEDTALSKAMRRVRTLRRIVLTGTPLQNNLIEYHCMVQFVKPNLLGTKKEFTNRFENPITNGQFDDSTEYDVRLMKKRAHVLHKMLEGSVQRLDYSVLTPFLPPKQEYVIFVKLTETQIKMYRHYLDNYARRHRGVGGSLFADFQALQRIWTHPLVMRMNAKKMELANEKKRLDVTDSEGSLRDFIDDGSDSDSSDGSDVQSISDSEDDSKQKPKRGTRANPVQDEPVVPGSTDKPEESNDDHEWWTQFVKDEDYEDIAISSKLSILFAILKESHSIGDKVLVFSQSLYSLTLIEEFLRLIDDATQNGNYEPKNLDDHAGSWSLGLDYFRLDGQSSTDNRRRWCDIFNKPSNTRARLFLISTRAGGLGINLTAANRVIIFDASWNPSHDVQSIFRIYRFGQKKPCYVYRLLAAGTMEEKIYNRQVTKLSLSCRVVDEQQIERHYSNNALAELYKLEISETEHTLNLPKDRLLADIFLKYKHCVENYHEHDSLLENQAGEELDEEERQQAWLEYEEEKKGHRPFIQNPVMSYQNEILMQQMNLINMAQSNPAITNPAMMLDYENIKQMMAKDYPGVSEAQKQAMATRTVYEMYNYVERQARQNPMPTMNLAAAPVAFNNRMAPQPLSTHPTPDMIRRYQQSLVQQSNGQMNFPNNHGNTSDPLGHGRNQPVAQIPQLSSQASAIPASVDDDIVEIPPSPEKNPVSTTPAPGGSRKSQEE